MACSFLFALGSFLCRLGVSSVPSDEAHRSPSEKQHKGKIDRNAIEVVAVLGVEGDFRIGFQSLADGIRYPVVGLLQHVAALVDEARATCVG